MALVFDFTKTRLFVRNLLMTTESACTFPLPFLALTWRVILWLVTMLHFFVQAAHAQDIILLSGGTSRITGQVKSISKDGNVEIESANASEPVVIHAAAVDLIERSQGLEDVNAPNALIELINGDVVAASIESMDSQRVTANSPHFGSLEFSREFVAEIRNRHQPPRLIYHGPKNANEWSDEMEESGKWRIEGHRLLFTGHAQAARHFELPQSLTLQFTLVWQEDTMPNYRITLADPLDPQKTAVDRYVFSLHETAMEIARESSEGKKIHSLVKILLSDLPLDHHRIEIDWRIDRHTGQMMLQVQKTLHKEFTDPVPNIPKADGLRIICMPEEGSFHEVRDIKIYGHGELVESPPAAGPANQPADVLVSREHDQWVGKLDSISTQDGELTYFFTTAVEQLLIEISEKDLSLVRLASPQKPADSAMARTFQLSLVHGSRLTVESCHWQEEKLTAKHSLMGALTLPAHGVRSIKRMPTPSP